MTTMTNKRFYATPVTEVIEGATQPMLRETSWTPDGGKTVLPIVDADDSSFPSLEDLYGPGNTSGGSGKVTGGTPAKASAWDDYLW